MPNPRRRHSKTRTRTRRAHDRVEIPTLSVDVKTGEVHRRHHAHWHEGSLFYKGRMVIQGKQKEAESDSAES